MKLGKDELQELLELVSNVEAFKPLVRAVLDALKSYSDELKEIPEAITRWAVATRIETIKQYEAAGFSREDAVLLTLDAVYAASKISERTRVSSKK